MGFWRAKKSRGFVTVSPGFCYVKIIGNSFFTSEGVTCGGAPSAFAGNPGLAPWNAQALAPFPQALAADAQFAGQFGLGHMVLMLKDEVLEVVFQ